MLPRGDHVQQVFYAGADPLLSGASSAEGKKLFIDCSTIDPDISREIGQKVQSSGLGDFSDAAVSVRHKRSPTQRPRLPADSKLHRAAPAARKPQL